jgi:hypothetical protein
LLLEALFFLLELFDLEREDLDLELLLVDFDRPLLDALFLEAPVFLGTFAPSFLASERPIAIACLRLVTFFPDLPDFNCPRFFSCIALSTFFPAPFEYFAMLLQIYLVN